MSHFAPDPSYSEETTDLLFEELYFSGALVIDEIYRLARKHRLARERTARMSNGAWSRSRKRGKPWPR